MEAEPTGPVCRIRWPSIASAASTRPRAARDERGDPLRVDVAHRQVEAVTQQIAGQLATDVAESDEADAHGGRLLPEFFGGDREVDTLRVAHGQRGDTDKIPLRVEQSAAG